LHAMQALCQLSYSPGRPKGTSLGSDPRNRKVGRDPVHLGGIPPETLEVVVVAGRGLKQMHDEIAVVNQDPLGFGKSLVAEGRSTLQLEQLLHSFGKRLDMGPGSAGCDYEHVGHNEEIPDLEQNDVESLLVGNGVGGQPSGGNCVY
jgi:hypothetical protein